MSTTVYLDDGEVTVIKLIHSEPNSFYIITDGVDLHLTNHTASELYEALAEHFEVR